MHSNALHFLNHLVLNRMEVIQTQCIQHLPTNSKVIIVSHVATAAGWIIKLVDCGIIIKLDSENEKPDGSCADRVVRHGGVILFDGPANLKPDFLQACYDLLSRKYGNIPIVWCSNKADGNPVLTLGDNNITVPHFEISANNDHNLEAPFLYLANKRRENDELLSVEPQPPVLIPPHIQMDMPAAQHGADSVQPESAPAAAQPGPVEGCCSACLKPLVEYFLKGCYYLVSIWEDCMNAEEA